MDARGRSGYILAIVAPLPDAPAATGGAGQPRIQANGGTTMLRPCHSSWHAGGVESLCRPLFEGLGIWMERRQE